MPTRTTTHDARPTLPVARSAGGADAAPRTHARERPRQCHVWAPALCALRARSRPHVARAPRATHRHAARGARVRAVLELRPPLRDGRAAHMSRAAYLVSNTAPIDLAAVRTAMPPPEVLAWCDGDGAGDYQPLWALTCALAPRTIVELGTRDARSTRVVAHAAPQAALTTIDIADCSAVVPAGATFVHADAASAFGAWRDPIDLLFVDTDPHSALQT